MADQRQLSIQIIVPITSEGFRDDEALIGLVAGTAELAITYLQSGPVSVESAVDEVLAGPGVISAAVQAEQDGFDAVVIDCMLDPALDAAREAVAIPVIACGETNMALAANGAKPFSIVTVLDRQERLFRQKARLYGLAEQLRSVRSIAVPVLGLNADPQKTLQLATEQALAAVQQDGAEAIVYGCTGMLGLGEPVREALRKAGHLVPVFDPLPEAVRAAEQAVRQRAGHDKSDYPYPQRKGYSGMREWPGLQALLEDSGG